MTDGSERNHLLRLVALAAVLALILAVGYAFGHTTRPATAPSATATNPQQKIRTVAFVGDSFTVGAGVTKPALRWSSVLARSQGWTERNGAVSGMGYAVGRDAHRDYPSQVRTLEASNSAAPDLVIVSGGWNDVATHVPIADILSGADHTLATARLVWPRATLVVVAPLSGAAQPTPELIQLRQHLRATADTQGAAYLDVGLPLAGHPELCSDGLHPTDAGAALVARLTESALRSHGLVSR